MSERAWTCCRPASSSTSSTGIRGSGPTTTWRLAVTTYRWTEIQARAAVLVLAGARTGKTRTLTGAVAHRITEAGITPGRLVAVTFTNKAAREMAERIRQSLGQGPLPSWIGTFHGLAARQLRIEPEVAGLRPGFDILDADDDRQMLKRTLKALNVGGGEETAPVGRDPLKVMCEEALMHARVLYAVAGLADQLSLLLDATGYRAMLRQSNAETYEDASRTRWS
jgi:DNA helicase-2/ATP-dependent DNA helicase PcrA